MAIVYRCNSAGIIRLAAAPAVVAVSAKWESAKVSGTVTSHASGLPFAQGSSVTPSGRLPSSRLRPAGSFTAGTDAFLKARHKMSLSWL